MSNSDSNKAVFWRGMFFALLFLVLAYSWGALTRFKPVKFFPETVSEAPRLDVFIPHRTFWGRVFDTGSWGYARFGRRGGVTGWWLAYSRDVKWGDDQWVQITDSDFGE